MKTYDLVVIGSGTAAQVASTRVRRTGRTVAMVDHRPFGGPCALRGCDPKKMLISGVEAIAAAHRMQGHGVAGELRISWPELIAFKRTVGPPLTPVSGHDRQKPDYRGVPSVAFTVPPIASVGLKESQAQQQGLKFKVKSENTPNWYTARRLAERVYGYKTLVEEGTGQILGAHIVGPQADEIINLFALAIRHNLTAKDLQTTMFSYPTGASDIGYMV
jgi:pyruvate/2-oxoglutarate dehydrogenase complex dihydrolipoamide dehydrogenase (E3) component